MGLGDTQQCKKKEKEKRITSLKDLNNYNLR